MITKRRDDASTNVDKQSSQAPFDRTRSVGSEEYGNSLYPMREPRVEVMKNSPSGQVHDLLKDKEYQRMSSSAKEAAGQAARDILAAT